MKLTILLLLLVNSVIMHAEIIGKTVEYTANNAPLKGYLVYDNSLKGKKPAVIVVHEWWGITDYPKKRAEMLASLGYIAFAAEVYGNGKTAETQLGNKFKIPLAYDKAGDRKSWKEMQLFLKTIFKN